jgi:DNA primase
MAGGGYDLDEIRRRADITEIISPHVALRKAGRRLVGLCPFHQERTPSFGVDPESGLWHCFGCKAGGDLFRFVEMIEKVDFNEAVEMLARRLGVQPRTPQQAGRQQEKERLFAILEAASKFFQAQLRTEAARAARAYLKKRGLALPTIEDFAIGYAPDGWDALLISMGKSGFSGQELARAGLVVAKEGGGFYDRFRDRIIFPISDSSGRVIAFGGRSLSDDQQPKYLNSPDGPLFQKGHVLYAFDRARRTMGDVGRAIIVEGYLDVIACHDAGFTETVATMGTALTPDHVELLRRRVPRLVLAFDPDSAGMKAALRSPELFQQAHLPTLRERDVSPNQVGLVVSALSLPDGLDPDQVIRQRGREAFQDLVSAVVPIIEWELRRIVDRGAASDGLGWEYTIREAVSILANLPEVMERTHYVGWLVANLTSNADVPTRARLQGLIDAELSRLDERKGGRARRTQQVTSPEGSVNKQGPDRKLLTGMYGAVLSGLIRHSEIGRPYVAELNPDDFPAGLKDIFEAVRGFIERGERVSAESMISALAPDVRPMLAELLLTEAPDERVEESIRSAVTRIVETRLTRKMAELSRKLGEAGSAQERERIGRELTQVASQRSKLVELRTVGQ